jgi:hypothetical protein
VARQARNDTQQKNGELAFSAASRPESGLLALPSSRNHRGEGAANTSGDEGVAATKRYETKKPL